MTNMFATAAIAALVSVAAPAAYAVSVSPFDTPVSAGDSTNGDAAAMAFEDFGMTSLTFTAAEALTAFVTATIYPFLTDISGDPVNSIALSTSINDGVTDPFAITTVDLPLGTIGTAGGSFDLGAGDSLTLFVTGVAGPSGNQVTFSVETVASQVPVPAAGLMLLTALGGAAALKRRKG